MSKELEPVPASGLRDHVDAGLRAVLSLVPGGGALVELINTVIAPSLERRQREWWTQLAEVVEEVRSRAEDFDLDQLAANERFVTAVIEASRVASMTHRHEKLGYLRNALIHMALGTDSDEFLAVQMLRFVDTLTPEHFLVLKYWSDPAGWFEANGIERPNTPWGGPGEIMAQAQHQLQGASLDIVHRDLAYHGLAQTDSLGGLMTERGMWSSRSTDLGNALLKFVSDSEQQRLS